MDAVLRTLLSLVVLLVLGTSLSARAEPEQDLMRARAHFDVGNGLYELGKYREAVDEFAAGYVLVHRPRFLLNLGQCYRKLNDVENARKMYEKYVAEAPPSDPARAQALQILAQLPITSPVAAPATALAPATVSAPAPTTIAVARKPSFVRRHWWIFPTAAVVLGGLATGIYFAVRPTAPTACSVSSDLACFTFGR